MTDPTRSRILSRAAELITGERQDEYGPPGVNFARIADGWNWWLESTGRKPVIDGHDVAMMMSLLKVARLAQSPGSADGYVDMAGYTGLAAELAGVED